MQLRLQQYAGHSMTSQGEDLDDVPTSTGTELGHENTTRVACGRSEPSPFMMKYDADYADHSILSIILPKPNSSSGHISTLTNSLSHFNNLLHLPKPRFTATVFNVSLRFHSISRPLSRATEYGFRIAIRLRFGH